MPRGYDSMASARIVKKASQDGHKHVQVLNGGDDLGALQRRKLRASNKG